MISKYIFTSKIVVFIFILWTSTSIAQYQSYKDIILSKDNTDSDRIEKVDSLLAQNIHDHQYEDIGLIAERFASWNYNRKRVAEAIAALNISIEYHNPENTGSDLQYKLYKIGFYNYKTGRYKHSTEAYKKAIKINDTNSRAGQAYYKIAANYYKLGDYELSRTYYELSEYTFKQLKDYMRLIKSYPLSYNTYSKIETKEALKQLEKNLLKADSLESTLSVPVKDSYNIKKALASYYNEYLTRDLKKGLPFANQALELARQIKDSSFISDAYIMIGILHDHEDPNTSIEYHKKALQYCPSSNKKSLSVIYANLGLNNAHLGNHKLSISQQLKSLRIYTDTDFKNTSPKQINDILNDRYDDNNLRVKLANIAESYLLYAEQTNNKDTLQEAIKFFKLADKTIDIYYNNSSANTSKLIWRRKATEIYGRALKACYLANDYTSALAFMEKNKALLLYEEKRKQKIIQDLQLPESFIVRERSLTNKLVELYKAKKTNKKSLQLQIAYQDSLQLLNDSIKAIHKNYKNIQRESQQVPYTYIKSKLKENEAIIQYHIPIDNMYGIYPNPTTGYGILITNDKTHFFEMDSLQLFKNQVEKLQERARTPITTKENITEYNIAAYNIFKKLFPTKEIRRAIDGKKLSIIPDNYLTTIPFESLIVSPLDNDYLIKHSQIHYKYSYTFHEETNKNQHKNSIHFSAFAPVDFKATHLAQLTNSLQEVKDIDTYFNGEIYSGVKANKTAFKESLKESNIIHLATHAFASDSITPWIAFSNEKLYLPELYTTQNNADLIFLSACNTSTGKIETGEGVLSLSRGFFYGGALSTVSSLWNVDDKSTQYIVKEFYKNLDLGKSKSLALHEAKLNYLENHSGSEISPYYWASFVLIGDASPLPQENTFIYYVIGSIGILLICMFIIRFLSKRKLNTSHKAEL